MEIRQSNLEMRASDKSFSGYVARYYNPTESGTETELLPGLFERLHPSCFSNINRDVVALLAHNPENALGRVSADTLKLRSDEAGLKATLKYNGRDTDHRKLKAKIESRTAPGCSLGFFVRRDEFSREDEKHIRWLLDVDLVEVSMGVAFPAYASPNMKIRSAELNEVQVRYDLWLETQKRFKNLERYSK